MRIHRFDTRKIKGYLELFKVTDHSWSSLGGKHNMLVDGAADIMAKALAGERTVNGVYLAYRNDPGAVSYQASSSNDAAYYATEEPDRGFVRIHTFGVPLVKIPAPGGGGAQITFLGVTDGTFFFPGTPVVDGVSVFNHSALVSMVEDGDQEDDMVFSCVDMAVPVTKMAGANLGARWTVFLPYTDET